ncbi:acyl-CoA dehydrogenase family protein [Tenuibacillus multivorans]|uniref:Acyl-CoA dehydrogenase n=1 Tax=Tenuibacillus multivorans TaxID=237069 RepID=A0A1H0B679_9BACI|nr:acyl-CoA dehydrogenase family protein [Tenuibacillus multivorans]GEL78628.1 putative acyl-CoA dehydrogenase YdbM [Tenuibacillus multivorans]SDN41144.1 Acyl-CoA dehydrogenase [Tenuibacillus multivorans]
MTKEQNIFLKNDRHVDLYKKATELSDQLKQYVKESDQEARFLSETVQTLKDHHYLSIILPEEYGGEDLSLYEWLLMQEKIAEGDAPTALSVGWHNGLLMDLKEYDVWSEEDFAWVAKEAGEQKLFNRASTEKNTGSPTRGGRPETVATRSGDGYVLNGRKTFTTMASVLDYAVVSAWVEDEEILGWFVIDMTSEGVSVDPTWDTLGMRGTASDDLVLDQVNVSQDSLVERKSKKSVPKGWLLHIPACYLGIAKAAIDDAVKFAKKFQPNSLEHPIAKVPHIRQKIGEMEMLLMRARHYLFSIAQEWDQFPEKRGELSKDLATVKVTTTNDANKIVDLAMRIAGGRGLSKDYPFERYYRDVRAGLHNPPMDDLVLEQLASSLLD